MIYHICYVFLYIQWFSMFFLVKYVKNTVFRAVSPRSTAAGACCPHLDTFVRGRHGKVNAPSPRKIGEVPEG